MKRDLVFAACFCALVLSCQCTVLLGQEKSSESTSPSANNNETAIRKSIASYVDAFNKGDAKALASHWGENGEFTTSDGVQLQGHLQLEESFFKYFAKAKGSKIELLNTSIEFLSPNVAQETGVARVIVPDQEPSETEYEVIHVKTSAGWKIDRVHEHQRPGPPVAYHEHLQGLDWLVGSWIDSDENSSIETECQWTENRNFLVRSFKVVIEDRIDFEGTQIIGWDAHVEAIRSWTFDSDGGFGVGRWSSEDNRWIVRTLNVLPDGRRASATNIYDRIDENSMRFRSFGRQVDGELMPSIDSVSVVRLSDESPSHSNASLEDTAR